MLTITVRLEAPVLPVASRIVPVTVCVPFESDVVGHGVDTGRAVVVLVAIRVPSTLNWNVLDAPLARRTSSAGTTSST